MCDCWSSRPTAETKQTPVRPKGAQRSEKLQRSTSEAQQIHGAVKLYHKIDKQWLHTQRNQGSIKIPSKLSK